MTESCGDKALAWPYHKNFALRVTVVMPSTTSITVLAHEYANGDKGARLLPSVSSEPSRIAGKLLRDVRAAHTLPPNALLNEMYVWLARESQPDLRDRAHFLSVTAHVVCPSELRVA